MAEGVALHEIVYDENQSPIDYRILDINKSYEKNTGLFLNEVRGKLSREVYKTDIPPYFKEYLNVAQTGNPYFFETYFAPLQKYFSISVISPQKGHFATVFIDTTEQIKANKERQLFNNVLEQSLNEIYIFDADTFKFITVNKGAIENIGYSMDELKQMTPYDIKPEFNEKKFKEIIIPLIENKKQIINFNTIHRRKNGTHYPVEVHLSINQNEKIFIAIILDITERMEQEKELLLSAEKFKNVFEHAAVGKSITSINGKLLVNKAFCDIVGYSQEELSIINWQEITHPEDVERDKIIVDSLIKGEKETARWTKRYIHKNGKVVWVDISSVLQKDKSGKPIHFITTINDITEQKRTAEELFALSQRQKTILATVPEIIMEVDNNKVYVWANKEGMEFFGEDVIGKEASYYFEGEQKVYDKVQPLFSGSEDIIYIESWQRRKDGEKRLLGWWCKVLKDTNEVVIGALSTARDITEQKKAEEEIINLNAELEQRVIERTIQLEQANKELEAFSYSVSHDLRAPLRGIDGFSLALYEDYYEKLDDEAKDFILRIRMATQKMDGLIDSLLTLSRVTRFEMSFKKVYLSLLAKDISDELKQSDGLRNAEFIIQENVIALGDANLIKIVLENLLNNAWKFTSKKENAVIKFGYLQKNSKLIYFVNDNGVGFDMKYSNKLFGAFQRLHSSKEYPGTGVGLTTVQRIIRRHNGEVWAEGEINKGATFYFTLG